MMLKGKSKNWARLKLLLLVPVGLIVLNAFARPEVNRQLETLIQSKDKETPPNEQQDVREFFKAELDKYIDKTENIGNPTEEYKSQFLDKKTDKQVLFINALGQILMNNEYATVDNLSDKLKNIFASRQEKPIAFYSLIDAGAPPIASTNILNVVKDAFLQQQAKAGKESNPILFYIDDNKNFKRNYQKEPQVITYYSVDGKKISIAEYEQLKSRAVRGAVRPADLADAKGRVITLHAYYKDEKDVFTPSPPFYYELSDDRGESYPILLVYQSPSSNDIWECIVAADLESVEKASGKINTNVKEVIIRPKEKNVPLNHLEDAQKILEDKKFTCRIINEVP